MKVDVLQENLLGALKEAAGLAPVRAPLSICSCVCLEAKDGRLLVASTDLAVRIERWVGAKIITEGPIVVDARLLLDVVSAMRNDKIVLESTDKTLSVVCGEAKARLPVRDPDDWPPASEAPAKPVLLSLDPDSFSTLVSSVKAVIAIDDMRPILTGALFEADASTLTMAATDGFRLAVDRITLAEPVTDKVLVVIPRAGLLVALKACSGKDRITITASPQRLVFSSGTVAVSVSLLMGSFPVYQTLIPKEWATEIRVQKDMLQDAVKLAMVTAKAASGIVRLKLSGGALVVSSISEEDGDTESRVDAQTITGTALRFPGNGRYLLDAIDPVPTTDVVMRFNANSSPMMLSGTEGEYRHVVMPMYVQWKED